MVTIEQAREWYQSADVVHDFDHILRVLQIALTIAEVEGADKTLVQTAVLLHDAEGALPEDFIGRASHHERSALFAGQMLVAGGWSEGRIQAVQHCIRAHRYRSTEVPQTIESQVVFDADKLDAIGAIGVARALAYAALHETPFYRTPSNQFIEMGELQDGEQHTAYHEFVFKLSKIKDRLYTKTAQEIATARHAYMITYFEQLSAEIEGKR